MYNKNEPFKYFWVQWNWIYGFNFKYFMPELNFFFELSAKSNYDF